MGAIEQLLVRLLPPTIHPMIVHFPIALGFLLLLVEMAAYATRDPFWERAGIWLINLEILAIGAAIIAGVISEHSAIVQGTSQALLSAHKRDGVLTGLLFGGLWIVRMGLLRGWRQPTPKRARQAHGKVVLRPSRPGIFSMLLLVGGLVMLTVTASLGGSLVYEHGVGVSGVAPAAGSSPGPASAGAAGSSTSSSATGPSATTPPSSSAAAAAGQQLWNQTCAVCHGQTPLFTAAWVNQVGPNNLSQFIAQAMPPGNPLPISKAKDIVSFLQSQ